MTKKLFLTILPFKLAKCKLNTADLTSPPEELITHSIISDVGGLYTVTYFLFIISATLFSANFKLVAEIAFNLK